MAADSLYFDSDYVNDAYTIEGVSINWATGEIFIPREWMELVQTTPTEIRKLDSNIFRLTLKSLEDDTTGMAYSDTHRHNASVLLGGIEYARIIEILAPYTVTFEDGAYAVQITGSNNNIGDRVNVNNGSVRSANSAGLIQTAEIQHGIFNGCVTVDLANGSAGTNYPVGTPIRPVNNITDARSIAAIRGFSRLCIRGDLPLGLGDDVSGMVLAGENAMRTMITIDPAADTTGAEIIDCAITGTLDGNTIIRQCYVFDLNYVNGFLFQCQLAGTIALGGFTAANFLSCFATVNACTVDMGGSGNALNVADWSGDLRIANKTGTDTCKIHTSAASVIIDASVTNGTGIHVDGVGEYINESAITPEHVNLLSPESISQATLAAAQVTPIHSNIKQVNGVTITGTGVPGSDEWRPATG